MAPNFFLKGSNMLSRCTGHSSPAFADLLCWERLVKLLNRRSQPACRRTCSAEKESFCESEPTSSWLPAPSSPAGLLLQYIDVSNGANASWHVREKLVRWASSLSILSYSSLAYCQVPLRLGFGLVLDCFNAASRTFPIPPSGQGALFSFHLLSRIRHSWVGMPSKLCQKKRNLCGVADDESGTPVQLM